MKVYNVGIIGFGFIGKVHAYGYATLPFFYRPVPLAARITHVATLHAETARSGAAMVGAEPVNDYRRITENPEIDIVHICTPNHLHKDALLSAIAHGKQVYCDKPLTATLEEADEVAAALDEYRGTGQMTFHNRFYPATLRARQLIDEGFLGRVLGFRACYLHAGSANPMAPAKWKLTAAAGGGVIADLASHALDLVHHFLGDFDAMLAETHIAYPGRPAPNDPSRMIEVDVEDSVSMIVRMKSGVPGTIEASKLATGTEDELRIELHGSDGAIRFNTIHPHYLGAFDATAAAHPQGGQQGWTEIAAGQRYAEPATGFPSPKASIGWTRAHVACLAHFLEAVARGESGDPSLRQGVYVQRLMDCARRSAQDRCWVSVDESVA